MVDGGGGGCWGEFQRNDRRKYRCAIHLHLSRLFYVPSVCPCRCSSQLGPATLCGNFCSGERACANVYLSIQEEDGKTLEAPVQNKGVYDDDDYDRLLYNIERESKRSAAASNEKKNMCQSLKLM